VKIDSEFRTKDNHANVTAEEVVTEPDSSEIQSSFTHYAAYSSSRQKEHDRRTKTSSDLFTEDRFCFRPNWEK